jgi:hypothetical protein
MGEGRTKIVGTVGEMIDALSGYDRNLKILAAGQGAVRPVFNHFTVERLVWSKSDMVWRKGPDGDTLIFAVDI